MLRALKQVGKRTLEKTEQLGYPAALFKGKGGSCEIVLKQP